MKRFLLLLATLCFGVGSALVQAQTTIVTFESAKVTSGDALPGSNCIVTVSYKIQPGYYLHSNRPTVPRTTATVIQVGTIGATRALPPAYSATGQKTIPGIAAPVPVYEGSLTAQIAIVLAPNAVFPVTLPGVVSYAPVNEKTHTAGRAEQVRFSIAIPRSTNPPPAKANSPTPDPKKAEPKKK